MSQNILARPKIYKFYSFDTKTIELNFHIYFQYNIFIVKLWDTLINIFIVKLWDTLINIFVVKLWDNMINIFIVKLWDNLINIFIVKLWDTLIKPWLHDETGLDTKRKMFDYLNVKLDENLEKRVPEKGRKYSLFRVVWSVLSGFSGKLEVPPKLIKKLCSYWSKLIIRL